VHVRDMDMGNSNIATVPEGMGELRKLHVQG
jgi:hypothetical protein